MAISGTGSLPDGFSEKNEGRQYLHPLFRMYSLFFIFINAALVNVYHLPAGRNAPLKIREWVAFAKNDGAGK